MPQYSSFLHYQQGVLTYDRNIGLGSSPVQSARPPVVRFKIAPRSSPVRDPSAAGPEATRPPLKDSLQQCTDTEQDSVVRESARNLLQQLFSAQVPPVSDNNSAAKTEGTAGPPNAPSLKDILLQRLRSEQDPEIWESAQNLFQQLISDEHVHESVRKDVKGKGKERAVEQDEMSSTEQVSILSRLRICSVLTSYPT